MSGGGFRSPVRMGLDLDNTLICYASVFRETAAALGWTLPNEDIARVALRDQMRSAGLNQRWTELQGEVYGPGMRQATPFPGAQDFIRTARQHKIEVYVISHRTRHPYAGPPYDLHLAALEWLERHGFFDRSVGGLSRADVFLEETCEAKLQRVIDLDCDTFVDDLPEFLAQLKSPPVQQRILFDPDDCHPDNESWFRVRTWAELAEYTQCIGKGL